MSKSHGMSGSRRNRRMAVSSAEQNISRLNGRLGCRDTASASRFLAEGRKATGVANFSTGPPKDTVPHILISASGPPATQVTQHGLTGASMRCGSLDLWELVGG